MEVLTIDERAARLRQLVEAGPFARTGIDVEAIVGTARKRELDFATDGITQTGIHGAEVYTNFKSSLGFNSASLLTRMESLGLLEKVKRIEQYPNGLRVIWNESGGNAPKVCGGEFFKTREAEVRRITNNGSGQKTAK